MKKNFSGEEELARVLDGFPSGNPYRVPDGYFNEFPLKLKERLVQPSMVEKIKAPSRRFIYTQLAYAASFALLVSFGYFGIRSLQPTKTAQPNAKVMVAKASNAILACHNNYLLLLFISQTGTVCFTLHVENAQKTAQAVEPRKG